MKSLKQKNLIWNSLKKEITFELDSYNLIIDISNNVKNIFGFLPKDMIGRSIFDFIKVDKSLKILLENAKDIIYTFQIMPEPKFVYISPVIEEIFGYNRQEYYDDYTHVFKTSHPDDVEILYKKMNNELDYSKPIISRWIHKDGYTVWIEDHVTPIYDNEGNFIAFDGICRDISERKVLEEKLNYLTYHDSLTGLKNRTFYDKQVEELNTISNLPVGIIVCDLDNLKKINDNIGHDNGDKIIKTASNVLLSIESEDVSISRIGGDEFAIIIKKADELKTIELCKKIKLLIKNYNLDNKEWPIKISIGHAFTDNSVGNMSRIFKEADKRMYVNKTYKKHNEYI